MLECKIKIIIQSESLNGACCAWIKVDWLVFTSIKQGKQIWVICPAVQDKLVRLIFVWNFRAISYYSQIDYFPTFVYQISQVLDPNIHNVWFTTLTDFYEEFSVLFKVVSCTPCTVILRLASLINLAK